MDSEGVYRPRFSTALLIVAVVFIVMALRQDVFYLVGAFLCVAGASLRRPLHWGLYLAIGVSFVLVTVGYSLGKQLALRDAVSCTAPDAAA